MHPHRSAQVYRFVESLRVDQLRRACLCVTLALVAFVLVSATALGSARLVPAAVGFLVALLLLPFGRSR